MNTNRQIWAMIGFLLLLTGVPAMAGGLYLHEFATPSTGTASAGSHAWANDASITFHNPAGMTRIDGDQFMLGTMGFFSNAEFEPASNTPNSGGGGQDAGGFIPAGATYFVHSYSDDLKFGVSLASLSGAALDYDDTWTGRYQAQEVEILTVYVTPTIGYRVNNWLSVGAGVSLIYADLSLDLAVPTNFQDGQASLDGDDTAFSFSLSTLVELSETTRFGMMYWYKTELNFSGDLTLSRLGLQVKSDTELVLPHRLEASIYHDVNDKIALLATIGWENWSALDSVNLSVGNLTAPLPKNWDDTWHFAGGLHYRLSDLWLLQCGIAYDTSPVDAVDRTADMPIDRQFRYAVGALHTWSEKLTIGGQLEYIDLGSAEINSSNLIGEYDTNDMIVASISFNWKW